MFSVGDKVVISAYDGYFYNDDIATVILIPGMPEYDGRGYIDAHRGIVIRHDEGEMWLYQKYVTPINVEISWEV